MTPTVTSRSGVASAASILLIATVIIVMDIRLGTLDVVPDVVGGVLVVLAMMRLRDSIAGADGTVTALLLLAVVGLPGTIAETIGVTSGVIAFVGVTTLIGTAVLANLLARALRASEPELAGEWWTTYQLVIALGLVPYLAGVALGLTGESVTIESPLALLLAVILAAPLIQLLMTLSRTRIVPAVAA